jgi:hypothetical protein
MNKTRNIRVKNKQMNDNDDVKSINVMMTKTNAQKIVNTSTYTYTYISRM